MDGSFSIGDGIAFAALLWFMAWMLAKLFPLRFGGSVEDYVAARRNEIHRKQLLLAQMRNDELEREKLLKPTKQGRPMVVSDESEFDAPPPRKYPKETR